MNHFHSAIQFTQKCAMKNKMNQVVKTVCMTFLVASKDLLIFFISLKQKKKKSWTSSAVKMIIADALLYSQEMIHHTF